MESFLNNLYPTFIEKESNQNLIEKDFISFIIDYEILFTINQIFPTEKESNEILNLKISKEKLSSVNQIDYLFLTLSTVPKFKIYIDNLLCLTEVKGDILEYSKYLKAITGVYIVLINSMNIKNLINIILSIANEINLINFQNKISYFDIKSLENVIYMKNKSKKIFDLICKYYYQISNGESILNSNTKSNIEYIINKLNSNQEKTLGAHDTLQGIKHHAVARLVKEQLHTHGLLCVLQFQRVTLGDGDDHAVTVNKRDATRKTIVVDVPCLLQVAGRSLGVEEHHWLAILEVVVYLLVALAGHFDAELIKRIIIGAPHVQREPGVAACHLARQPHRLAVQAIGLLLLLVFHLEQMPLMLQLYYG